MNVKKMLAAVSAGMLLLGLLPLSVPASAEETETVTETYNMDGFEKAPQSALDTLLKTESVALTAGITDDKYVADGAESAVKVAYLKDPENWGQVLLYADDAEAETRKGTAVCAAAGEYVRVGNAAHVCLCRQRHRRHADRTLPPSD